MTQVLDYLLLKINEILPKIKDRNKSFAIIYSIFIVIFIGMFFYNFSSNLKNELTFSDENLYLRNYITENTSSSDKIINIGGGNNIYLTSDRQAASRFFYQIPLVHISPKDNRNSIEYKFTNISTEYINEDITREFINDLETNTPKVIILTHTLQLGQFFDWEIKKYLESKVHEGTYIIDERYNEYIDAILYLRVK